MAKFVKWHMPPHLIHVLVWLFIYIIPIFFILASGENPLKIRYWTTVPFFTFMLAFYANYSFLIPKFLYKKRIVIYVIVNIALFFVLHLVSDAWREHAIANGMLKPPAEPTQFYTEIFKFFTVIIFTTGIAISIRSTSMWFQSKSEMQELELENLHSELSLLKTQISPHFLFNTLNNILTLIDENKELAKQSVQELSKLLRSMLYDSEAETITIEREVEFLTNYSNLMRLRYGESLNFCLATDLSDPKAPIAPLLLIPILENVFKHGIGPSLEDSSISIKVSSAKNKIIYESINTYFPKTNQDKSGSGIGIANMRKRLNLLYENRYTYDCKIEGNNYVIKLEINTSDAK